MGAALCYSYRRKLKLGFHSSHTHTHTQIQQYLKYKCKKWNYKITKINQKRIVLLSQNGVGLFKARLNWYSENQSKR